MSWIIAWTRRFGANASRAGHRKTAPTDTGHLRRQAHAFALAGHHRKAADLYEKISGLSPLEPEGYRKLADLRRRLGDLPGAREAFARAAALFLKYGFVEGPGSREPYPRYCIGKRV